MTADTGGRALSNVREGFAHWNVPLEGSNSDREWDYFGADRGQTLTDKRPDTGQTTDRPGHSLDIEPAHGYRLELAQGKD